MAKKDAQGNLHDDSNGRFTSKNETAELEKKYNDDLPLKIPKPEKAYGFANNERKVTKDHLRHAKDMGIKNQDEYERAACKFFNSAAGKLYYEPRRKRFYRYDERSNKLAVSSTGVIHTFLLYTRKKFEKVKQQEHLYEL